MSGQADMPLDPSYPSFDEIWVKTLENLGRRPCLWQVHICDVILCGQDVILLAATGSGKTLTFWMPLPFRLGGIQIVVTPLNILSEQNNELLSKLSIEGIFISAKTATECNFRVSILVLCIFNLAQKLSRTLLRYGIESSLSIRRS